MYRSTLSPLIYYKLSTLFHRIITQMCHMFMKLTVRILVSIFLILEYSLTALILRILVYIASWFSYPNTSIIKNNYTSPTWFGLLKFYFTILARLQKKITQYYKYFSIAYFFPLFKAKVTSTKPQSMDTTLLVSEITSQQKRFSQPMVNSFGPKNYK